MKYLVTAGVPFVPPTISEYDEDDIKDDLRDSIRDEIQEEVCQELQNAVDEKELDLDGQIDDIAQRVDEAMEALSSLSDRLNDLSSETGLRLEDHI